MKQHITLVIKSVISMIILLFVQLSAWALETNATLNESNDIGSFFSKPWIWIAPIVVTIIILAGPFHTKKDFTVIMKKRKHFKVGETVFYQRAIK